MSRHRRAIWDEEAQRHAVRPLMDDLRSRIGYRTESVRPMVGQAVHRPGGRPVADEALPLLLLGFEIAAPVTIAPSGPHGILAALGDAMGGFVLHGLAGRLVFSVSLAGDLVRLDRDDSVDASARLLGVRYRPAMEDGVLELEVDAAVEPPFPWTGEIDRVVLTGEIPDLSALEAGAASSLRSD